MKSMLLSTAFISVQLCAEYNKIWIKDLKEKEKLFTINKDSLTFESEIA